MNPVQMWQDFQDQLKKGSLPSYKFRPYDLSLTDTIPQILERLRSHIIAISEEKHQPECFITGNQYHFVLNLGPGTNDFCFSFMIENGLWYFQHIENIFIRLDQVGTLPVSKFPDLPENTKSWCRDELLVSKMITLYSFLSNEKGKEFAMNWFRDGKSYFVGARAWVPFVTPSKAFILYVCWEWANLQSNPVTLIELDETKAIIRARLRHFELFKRAGHLSQQISEKDYVELFETIWQDRSFHAGWNLQIDYEAEDCVFKFTKATQLLSS